MLRFTLALIDLSIAVCSVVFEAVVTDWDFKHFPVLQLLVSVLFRVIALFAH